MMRLPTCSSHSIRRCLAHARSRRCCSAPPGRLPAGWSRPRIPRPRAALSRGSPWREADEWHVADDRRQHGHAGLHAIGDAVADAVKQELVVVVRDAAGGLGHRRRQQQAAIDVGVGGRPARCGRCGRGLHHALGAGRGGGLSVGHDIEPRVVAAVNTVMKTLVILCVIDMTGSNRSRRADAPVAGPPKGCRASFSVGKSRALTPVSVGPGHPRGDPDVRPWHGLPSGGRGALAMLKTKQRSVRGRGSQTSVQDPAHRRDRRLRNPPRRSRRRSTHVGAVATVHSVLGGRACVFKSVGLARSWRAPSWGRRAARRLR